VQVAVVASEASRRTQERGVQTDLSRPRSFNAPQDAIGPPGHQGHTAGSWPTYSPPGPPGRSLQSSTLAGQGEVFYWESGEMLEETAQRGCGCPIPGGV